MATNMTISLKESPDERPISPVLCSKATGQRRPGEHASKSHQPINETLGPRSAIFVAHEMGQQLRFDTLNQIANGLIQADIKARKQAKDTTIPNPEVITIKGRDDYYLHGVKLQLKGDKVDHEVHLFEGYWAPLTEGAVTLRDVMLFLISAGFNGLAKTGRPFIRFLFNGRYTFPANFLTTIYLLTAMLTAAALVIMNTAIVTVAALSSPLAKSPLWLEGLRPVEARTLLAAQNIGIIRCSIGPCASRSQECLA